MTKKLYDLDAYETMFQATIIDIENNNIILDQTLFFPNEGGQPSDIGYINGFKVVDVQIKDNIITHKVLDHNLKIGDKVSGEIDFKRRFDFMQNHSGEHIFSGIVHKLFGYDNVGFHLGLNEMTIDFNGVINDNDLKDIEDKVNEAIYKNVPITCFYIDDINKYDYRSKLDLKEDVRLVEIKDYDLCACCAPHCKNTGEIGLFKIVNSMSYKGGVRISALCGQRAFSYLRKEDEMVKNLYSYLSANENTLITYVHNLNDKVKLLESNIKQLKINRIEDKLPKDNVNENIILFEEDIDTNIQRLIVNKMIEKTSLYGAFFIGNDKAGYRYIIASKTLDMNKLLDDLKELNAKGGGNKDMIQGFIKNTKENLIDFFKRESL